MKTYCRFQVTTLANKKNTIPDDERIWTHIISKNGEHIYITSKKTNRDTYFIYKVDGENVMKLGKGKNPAALEEKYIEE